MRPALAKASGGADYLLHALKKIFSLVAPPQHWVQEARSMADVHQLMELVGVVEVPPLRARLCMEMPS